jgi:hypothetical protein
VSQAQTAGELANLVPLVGGYESDPDALGAGASGAPDAMDVGVAVVGRIEVDHVRDPRDVDPPGGDIGGDENVDRARLEACERLLALALGLVAVHRHGVDAVPAQAFDQPVSAVLGADEHERELAVVSKLGDERFDAVLV